MSTKKIWFCSWKSRYNQKDVFVFVKADTIDDAKKEAREPHDKFQIYELNNIKHIFQNIQKTRKRIDFDFLNSSYSVCLHEARPFIVRRSIQNGKNYYQPNIDFYDIEKDVCDYIISRV